MSEQIDGVDFALAAYREEGVWQVQELAHDVLDGHGLPGRTRCAASPATVARWAWSADRRGLLPAGARRRRRARGCCSPTSPPPSEWELADSAVEFLGLPDPEDEDEQVPAGDLDLLGDLGMHAMDIGVLLDDFDLYPDEMLSDVARRLGFGDLFDDLVGLTSA